MDIISHCLALFSKSSPNRLAPLLRNSSSANGRRSLFRCSLGPSYAPHWSELMHCPIMRGWIWPLWGQPTYPVGIGPRAMVMHMGPLHLLKKCISATCWETCHVTSLIFILRQILPHPALGGGAGSQAGIGSCFTANIFRGFKEVELRSFFNPSVGTNFFLASGSCKSSFPDPSLSESRSSSLCSLSDTWGLVVSASSSPSFTSNPLGNGLAKWGNCFSQPFPGRLRSSIPTCFPRKGLERWVPQ